MELAAIPPPIRGFLGTGSLKSTRYHLNIASGARDCGVLLCFVISDGKSIQTRSSNWDFSQQFSRQPPMPVTLAEKAPAPKLIAIAAMASNRVIGRDGKLPWHLPEDLKFFKKTTQGHPVLMGRNTFNSIVAQLGKPLPGRRNIVLSKTMPAREGVEVVRSLEELKEVAGSREQGGGSAPESHCVYLIGGAQLYETLLPQCDELLLTYITAPHEGDAFFPPFGHLFVLKEVIASGDGFEIRRYVTSSARPSP